MFEIIGYWVLRFLGLRKPTKTADVFGSFFERNEGPTEFAVGFVFILAVFILVGVLDK